MGESTAADLIAFITALTGNKLLDAQYTWLATSPKSPVPPKGPPPAGKPPAVPVRVLRPQRHPDQRP
jgi:hypothetical protein